MIATSSLGTRWRSFLRRLAASRPLLKTAVRGGVLRLTGSTLVYGEGPLGSRNPWQLPLATIEAVEVLAPVASGGVSLRIRTVAGQVRCVEGVSPAAARRLVTLVTLLGGHRG